MSPNDKSETRCARCGHAMGRLGICIGCACPEDHLVKAPVTEGAAGRGTTFSTGARAAHLSMIEPAPAPAPEDAAGRVLTRREYEICFEQDLGMMTRNEINKLLAHDAALRASEAALAEKVGKLEKDLWIATINNEEGDEIAAELFDLCCAVVDGKPDAAAARDSLQKHIEHVRSCRRGSCATELGETQTARAGRLEAALREIADEPYDVRYPRLNVVRGIARRALAGEEGNKSG